MEVRGQPEAHSIYLGNKGFIVKFCVIHSHEEEPERIQTRSWVQRFKTDVVTQRHGHMTTRATARDCETVVQDAMPSTAALTRMDVDENFACQWAK